MNRSRSEPTLQELLDDPLILSLMKRDGVDRDYLRRLLEDIKKNLQTERRKLAA